MKFKLVESFNYPVLYHGTYNINEILRDNSLHLGKTYGNLKPAVCLTRDYNFVKNKFPFIIVLNKDKLTTKYKIRPITDYKNFSGNTSARFSRESKAEEVCYTPINNLLTYVDYIIVDDKYLPEPKEEDGIHLIPKSLFIAQKDNSHEV